MRRAQKNGFTLIELLVVIAIIAILAAILFPVFARARENARRSSCQSNLKQMSLGVMQYTQDYDGVYPSFGYGSYWGTPVDTVGWAEKIQPYLKSTQIYQCPSEPTPEAGGFTDYFYNSNLNAGGWSNGVFERNKDSDIGNTSAVILFGDNRAHNASNYANCFSETTADCGTPYAAIPNIGDVEAPKPPAQTRHLDGANYAFVDGHVKWYRPEKLTYGAPSAGNPTFRPRDS